MSKDHKFIEGTPEPKQQASGGSLANMPTQAELAAWNRDVKPVIQAGVKKTWEKIKELNLDGAQLLPLMPAGHAKIKDLYRFQFIVKTVKSTVLEAIEPLLPPSTPDLSIKIDVDPINTFF